MRDKLGMAAFVVLLVAVWGVGFLWVRGDLDPSADKVSASNADAKDERVAQCLSERIRERPASSPASSRAPSRERSSRP